MFYNANSMGELANTVFKSAVNDKKTRSAQADNKQLKEVLYEGVAALADTTTPLERAAFDRLSHHADIREFTQGYIEAARKTGAFKREATALFYLAGEVFNYAWQLADETVDSQAETERRLAIWVDCLQAIGYSHKQQHPELKIMLDSSLRLWEKRFGELQPIGSIALAAAQHTQP